MGCSQLSFSRYLPTEPAEKEAFDFRCSRLSFSRYLPTWIRLSNCNYEGAVGCHLAVISQLSQSSVGIATQGAVGCHLAVISQRDVVLSKPVSGVQSAVI